ncbi:MAG: MATE family efflux transporter [Ruminococcus sp.]|nr:MATE family efflux transporter [Ruminococcus sp.]
MTKDMTTGSPVKLILGFAFPMFLGMLFQQFYSMVDTMLVGQFLGVNPLAGVGSTGSLNFMVIGFCTGVCSGFAIPVAQMFGAKQESELRKFVTNSAWLSIVFSIVLTTAVAILCRQILIWMNTPEEIFDYAYDYIFVVFLGIPCTFLYNLLSSIIRSLGDSKTPVVFLAISSVLNIGLDLLLILVIPMGVAGAAWATVIAQGFSGLVCLLYMRKKYPILHATKEEWMPRRRYMMQLCGIGIPMGLQYSITAIGTIVLQAAVNGLGAVYVAAVTAAGKINSFVSCPIEALGFTMAPYSGQNMGAGKIKRIQQGVLAASVTGFILSAVLFGIVFLTGKQMALLFVDASETAIIQYAYQYLLVCTGGYCLLTLVDVVRFSIQGMGFSVFAISAGVLEMIARILAAVILVPTIAYMGICLANSLAWVFADVFLIPAFFFCRNKLLKRHAMAERIQETEQQHSVKQEVATH